MTFLTKPYGVMTKNELFKIMRNHEGVVYNLYNRPRRQGVLNRLSSEEYCPFDKMKQRYSDSVKYGRDSDNMAFTMNTTKTDYVKDKWSDEMQKKVTVLNTYAVCISKNTKNINYLQVGHGAIKPTNSVFITVGLGELILEYLKGNHDMTLEEMHFFSEL